MRPESIRWFERVYIGRIVVGLAVTVYSAYWASRTFGDYPPAGYLTGWIGIGTVMLGLMCNGLLLYFIGRRASRVAKWIFIAGAVLGMISVFRVVIAPNFFPAIFKIGSLFLVGLDFTMIMLMFQPDSRDWFERRGLVEQDYAETFS
ncbi:hypothetical protein HZF05_09225 [Sphingomonas sp. CGMCC 1.13654]|uniref:Uncharacterized protein n=1 Tax=Sphingomonas chungangi TaxID=2683589 RepID=A0A838L5S7_9SPHN|nr:hypothetical protein [Sphingomonas chungangi]MBA2934280.1 hypothetical protein [Sphingomonas chungangi]MVW57321.1 hypothetical protein [Sphingomonas chungangi]